MVTYSEPKQPYYHYHTFLDWLHGYHESERQWLDTAISMKCWFIITIIQCYGHVARDPRNAGPWSQVREGHGHRARDHTMPAHYCKLLILMVWNCEINIGLYNWPCAHMASYGVTIEPTTIAWNCSHGVKSQLITSHHRNLPNSLTYGKKSQIWWMAWQDDPSLIFLR